MASLSKMPRITRLGGDSATPAQGIPTVAPITHAPARPPSGFRRPTLFPQGPDLLGLGRRRQTSGGPGEPPAGFVTGTTSAVEWILFWASWKLFRLPGDPRTGPFTGDGIHFTFQTPQNPANPREAGGSVSDFVYYLGTGTVILRLDTFFYHTAASSTQQAKDLALKQQAHRMNAVVRTIYDTQIIGDPSGEAAVRALAEVLSGQQIISPTWGGNAYEVRNRVTGLVP